MARTPRTMISEVLDVTNLSVEQASADPLHKEIDERWKSVKAHYAQWDDVAHEDMRFALGEQWTTEQRNILVTEGRPALTFNRIKPVLGLVSGYQRENSTRISVSPEGGEDRIFSEVMDRTIKFVDKWAHLSSKMSYWFDDGLSAGKGWLEASLNYDRDPIRGELDFKLCSPFQIRADPEHREYDLNDGARYMFKVTRLSRQTLIELYPTKARLIKGFKIDRDDPVENGDGAIVREGADDDYGNQPNQTTVVTRSTREEPSSLPPDAKFTVKEYWRYKLVPKYFVIDKSTGVPRGFHEEAQATTFITEQQFGKVVKRQVKEMWVSAKVAGFVLQDEKSPFEPLYHGYPFFRFIAEWSPNAPEEHLRVQGMVRALKDPQMEKNKAKSQFLHILNTQANSGWIGDEEALDEEGWKQLKKMGAKPGVTVRKKKGYELREIQAKLPSQGHLLREEQADNEFKQISGVNPDLLGFSEGTASGKAISLRIQQAVLALVRLFANYRYSKEILGRFILQMVPMLFDVTKLKRALGADYLRKAVSAAAPFEAPQINPETGEPIEQPSGLRDGQLEAYLQLVREHKYDVSVAEAGQSRTIRFEIFEALVDMVKAGMPIPPDLVIEYMDLPNSEEVKKRVQEAQSQAQQAAATQGA